eukprot:jgi/Mesvir1/3134/Mv16306-RA.1
MPLIAHPVSAISRKPFSAPGRDHGALKAARPIRSLPSFSRRHHLRLVGCASGSDPPELGPREDGLGVHTLRTDAEEKQAEQLPIVDHVEKVGSIDGQPGAVPHAKPKAVLDFGRLQRASPIVMMSKPLPKVLLLHTGGTLGMDPEASFEQADGELHLRKGTGGHYPGLQPGKLLTDMLQVVPELRAFANLDVYVVCNKDSSRVGPRDWAEFARLLDHYRDDYEAFIVVHGTDTMAFTASALSLMLAGFRKPIVLTGSQLPLAMPRSDARQNLIDSISCATSSGGRMQEVAVCFGGKLMRGNRAQKANASSYSAFNSPSYPDLAVLGVDIEWREDLLHRHVGVYRPRFELDPNVMRVPIVPGCDPRMAYGDVYGRGVRGIVLEAFGVGNMPDEPEMGWIPWLEEQTAKGLMVYMASQCGLGTLHPELYRSGNLALQLGVESGPQMTPECAVCKLMLCLKYTGIPVAQPIAGEL